MQTVNDYRQTLRRVLVERCGRNPKYSLRAFARDLELAPARLSDILNGNRGLSRATALPIARALGLGRLEVETFCDQVDALHARSRAARIAAKRRLETTSTLNSTNVLTLDAFHAISDWYHLAILELLKLENASDDPVWISNSLGVQKIAVIEALERLKRLELIEKRKGRLRPAKDFVLSPDGVPSSAIKKFHEQILKKATLALFEQPLEQRDFLSTMITVRKEDVEIVRKRIRQFNRKIVEEFSDQPKSTRVYNLSIQFFDLTTNLKETGK